MPKSKAVNLYTCGPTVYENAHIGNLRSYIFADVLRRTLEYDGYKVNWVMNITDIDDKTIKRTVDEYGKKATPQELRKYTDKYFADFKKDMEAVNVPTDSKHIKFIRVSDELEEIKKFIKDLIKLGYAYKTDDGVYFSIEKYQKKFGDYGALVGKDFLKGKKIGARVKVDEYEKENLSDFALWKGRDESDGNIFWEDEEFGEGLPATQELALQAGRPGWHIECSVINKIAFRGEPTDIHTGGVDLLFPHHTNEIAQSQPLYKPFVNHWSHCEHLLVNGRKMAKSEGNFYTLKDLEKEISDAGIVFRYLVLQTNYRTQMNFTLDSLKAAEAGLEHLSDARFNWNNPGDVVNTEEYFLKALNDDLNTAEALAILGGLVGFKNAGARVDKMADALGIKFFNAEITPEVRKLKEEYEECRRNKQFVQSDALRKKIKGLGYTVRDTETGSIIRRARK